MDDMGTHTTLGSFPSFAGLWVVMMAAMMLPAAAPATVRQVQLDPRVRTVPLFVAPYLAVWASVGAAVFALYRPHGTVAAGCVVIAAGLYELTPMKRYFRARCLEQPRTGVEFGYCCVGSSIGLMAVLLALGVMNIGWMAAVAGAVLVQKLLPPNAAFDIPFALAIVALGIAVVAS